MRAIGVVGVMVGMGVVVSGFQEQLLQDTLFRGLSNGVQLTLMFDGGFVFSKKDTQLLVGTVDTANHPLKVRQLTGSGLGNDLDISGGRLLRILPDGADVLETLPGLPGYDKTQVDCADKDQLPGWRNNMLFMPSLKEAATVMGGGTAVKRDIPYDGHIVLTGGGALYIRRLGGCVVLQNAQGRPISKKSMASGEAGIAYTWVIPAASTVQLRRLKNGTADGTYNLAPTAGGITLHVSSTFGTGSTPTEGQPIAHYPHFKHAYDHYDPNKQPKLIWFKTYFTSPGVDCPPAGDWP